VLGVGLDHDLYVADHECCAGLERGCLYLGAADARVIRRAQVAYDEAARARLELAVVA
jgi:hypothetical protein